MQGPVALESNTTPLCGKLTKDHPSIGLGLSFIGYNPLLKIRDVIISSGCGEFGVYLAFQVPNKDTGRKTALSHSSQRIQVRGRRCQSRACLEG